MPLLGFTVLKDKIVNGTKTQTIRVPRKHPLKTGDKLFVYWKPRTKQCEKLGESEILSIQYKTLSEMTELDALLDGFQTLDELIDTLCRLHPDYNLDQTFEIVTFKPLCFRNKEIKEQVK